MNSDVLLRNNVHVTGHGDRTIIFAHGFGCDQNMWRFVAPAFEANYRVVLFDYVGCGKSDVAAYDLKRYSSLEGYAQDVLEICEALSLTDVIYVGHSVSSVIGMLAAIRAPKRFSELVLIGPSPRYVNDGDYVGGLKRKDIDGLFDLMDRNYIGWATYLAPLIVNAPDQPGIGEELTESFCSTDPVIARQFASVTFYGDNRNDLARVTTPSLILQCSQDMIAPLSVGEYVHRHLMKSTFRLMQATGHCPHMSHPDETIRLIQEYLGAREAA